MIYSDTTEQISSYYEGDYCIATLNHSTNEFELHDEVEQERAEEIEQEMIAYYNGVDLSYDVREHGVYGKGY